jgi:hypothetical protein
MVAEKEGLTALIPEGVASNISTKGPTGLA